MILKINLSILTQKKMKKKNWNLKYTWIQLWSHFEHEQERTRNQNIQSHEHEPRKNKFTDKNINFPSQIYNRLPYLVSLDLFSNAFARPISSEIANCKFLNSLILSNKCLSGLILERKPRTKHKPKTKHKKHTLKFKY